jgi:hypothetical protein
MYEAKEGLPTPISTIDTLLDEGDSSEQPIKVFIGHNLGNRTFLTTLPMHELFGMSEVANDRVRDGDTVAQRKLDPAHAQRLAVYLLKGLVAGAVERRRLRGAEPPAAATAVLDALGRQPYLSLQPIVANIRDCVPAGANIRGVRMVYQEETACFKVWLSQRHVLWIIDGQHRRKAMQYVFEFLDTVRSTQAYPKKGSLFPVVPGADMTGAELELWQECFEVARTFCTVAVEIHLGLSPDEERQLFHDLNNLGKKVEASLALQFDNSNAVNLFIKERLMQGLHLHVVEKDVTDWHNDDGGISRKDLVAVNALLFLNKTNIGGATPPMVTPKADIAYRFWETIAAIPGFGEDGAREKTVAAQPVALKAIAKLTYDFAFSNRRGADADDNLETLLSRLTEVDFGHDNPMWRYYSMTPAERTQAGLDGLAAYLPPSDDGANRDIGAFQGGVMRFGAKHNDIFPIIGDMIRWRLGLPSRQKAVAAA